MRVVPIESVHALLNDLRKRPCQHQRSQVAHSCAICVATAISHAYEVGVVSQLTQLTAQLAELLVHVRSEWPDGCDQCEGPATYELPMPEQADEEAAETSVVSVPASASLPGLASMASGSHPELSVGADEEDGEQDDGEQVEDEEEESSMLLCDQHAADVARAAGGDIKMFAEFELPSAVLLRRIQRVLEGVGANTPKPSPPG